MSAHRQLIASGSPWEPLVGYSRAVRVGQHIAVAGTTAVDAAGEVFGTGDPYLQSAFILRKIEAALREAGAELSDVVRTRIYVTSIDDWEQVARAHREVFAEIRPAATMVEVGRLVGPELLVEIEAEAIIAAEPDNSGDSVGAMGRRC